LTVARKSLAFATTSAAAAVLALGADVASAHTVRYDSQVAASFVEVPGPPTNPDSGAGWDYFSGTVASPKHLCEAGRTVRVYPQQPGSDPAPMLFLATASPSGFWKYHFEDPPNGTYHARAARRVLASSATHTHVCRHASSPDFAVADQP
jgi:hypothetical protein